MKRASSSQAEPRRGSLFRFNFQRREPPRTWRNVANRDRFTATLQQQRAPEEGDDIGYEIMQSLRNAIGNEVDTATNLRPHHLFHFNMQSDQFTHAFQSTTFTVQEFREGSDRLDTYLQSLGDKLNSNQDLDADDDTFTVELTLVRTPGPGGTNPRANKLGRYGIERVLRNKKSIIVIKNEDQLCCARAIVTMKALADGGRRNPDYEDLRRGRNQQTIRARELHLRAGVPEGPCDIPELQKFQDFLTDYQIKVLAVDKPHMIVFAGPPASKQILLVKVDDHYHGCNSFAGFLERNYFCHDCNKGYNVDDFKHHACKRIWCRGCKKKGCPDWDSVKAGLVAGQFPSATHQCSDCNRLFYGQHCYDDHKKETVKERSLCQHYKKCIACKAEYDAAPILKKESANRPKFRHRCGWGECPFCEKDVPQTTHQCFIQPVDPSDDEPKLKRVRPAQVGDRHVVEVDPEGYCKVEKPPPLFVYADYEAMTDPQGLQTPILVCCETEDDDETQVFYGEDCTESFFDFLDDLVLDDYGDERKLIVIFHNFKGYDGMFVLQHLYQQHRTVDNQITVGTKVLSLQNDLITFKDSLCFLPFPLASFPATFDLTEQCKGFFPHLFNTSDNQEYDGVIPDIEYYDPEGMSSKKKTEFEQWHAAKVREGYRFRMQEEMKSYCISDVKLLKTGCQKFQKEFFTHAEFNPMEKCITIASACNRYWRKKLLPQNTIAVEPPRGWHGATTNTSLVAREWLAYENHLLRLQHGDAPTHPDRIRTATNGGEVRVYTPAQSFLVDGHDGVKTIYEFNGCLWHGCPQCFPKRSNISRLHTDRTFQELYEATCAKSNLLQHEGYDVKQMWECRWKWEKQHNEDLTTFLQSYEPSPRLQPRDAFFGGRTNAVKLYSCVNPTTGEKIFYVDVTSLYPWVNAEGEYPIGHPEVITSPNTLDITQYFGVALVDILPPYELYHPVLPHRQGGKLTFPLCSTCVAEEMKKPMSKRSAVCIHSVEERTLRGTWCTPELQKAVEKGYVILKIHEVWHFKDRKKGLFLEYVNQWLKIKQESAGYPSWADTPEKKVQYVADYKTRQGIDLDPDKIAKNPGRKATAKLMLNSFWGKFGENLNKQQVEAVTSPAALFHALYRNIEQVERIRLCTPDVLELVTRQHPDNLIDNGKRNLFIAAFTTCYARLKLYSYLDQLQQQVVYFDTDSVVYKWAPGQPQVPFGDYLGEMTDELEGDVITEFVSGGPKNYGYKTAAGKVCCKVRGFTLNVRGDKQLNYEVMKRNVIDEVQQPLEEKRLTDVNNPHFFTRDPSTKRIRVVPRTKKYALVFDKRVVNKDTFDSFPYGYSRIPDEDVQALLDL